MNERTIWQGRQSLKTLVSLRNAVLICITFGIYLVVLAVRCLKIMKTEYTITDKRIRISEGFIGSTENQVDLLRVKDYRVHRTALNRMMGIGDVIISSTDTSSPTLRLQGIAQPLNVKEQILAAAEARKDEKGLTYRETM